MRGHLTIVKDPNLRLLNSLKWQNQGTFLCPIRQALKEQTQIEQNVLQSLRQVGDISELHDFNYTSTLEVFCVISAFDKKLILTGHDVPAKYSLS